MNKKYFYILFLALFLGCFSYQEGLSQTQPTTAKASESIDGLNIYPNPISEGRVYIDTKLNSSKDIALYNVLGKKILSTTITGRELLLPYTITPGVYIITVKEKEATSTRKIVIK